MDDHYFIRQGLKSVLREYFADILFDETGSATEALEKVSQSDWDIVLLDISMPGRSGLEVLKELRDIKPGIPVIILSAHAEEQFAVRVLKLGASSYIRKDRAGHELVEAIEAALRGGKYITPSIAQLLAAHLEKKAGGPAHETLTDREYQVMCLMASGKTVTEIGFELSLSVKTISTYRARILMKTNLQNNAQIIRYALQHGIVGALAGSEQFR